MPSTPPRSRSRLGALALAALVTTATVAACAGRPHRAAGGTGPTTTLITQDRWSPPQVSGPPSPAKFCALLVADYEHLATASQAADVKVREQIVSDSVAFAPAVTAAAPPQIAAAAGVYFPDIARFLQRFASAGFDAKRLPAGVLSSLLSDPSLQKAQSEVVQFAAHTCHYNVGI